MRSSCHTGRKSSPSLFSPTANAVAGTVKLLPLPPTLLPLLNFAFLLTRGVMLVVGVVCPPSSPLVSRDSLPSSHEPTGPIDDLLTVSSSAPEMSED